MDSRSLSNSSAPSTDLITSTCIGEEETLARYIVICHTDADPDTVQTIFDGLVQRYGEWRVRWADAPVLYGKQTGNVRRALRRCAVLIVPVTHALRAKGVDQSSPHRIEAASTQAAEVSYPQNMSGAGYRASSADKERLLLAGALQSPRILVIPVLPPGTPMPTPFDLAPEITTLAFRNALQLPPPHDIDAMAVSIDRSLIQSIQSFLPTYERANHPYLALWTSIGFISQLLSIYPFIFGALSAQGFGEQLDATGAAWWLAVATMFALGPFWLALPTCWFISLALTIRWRRWWWTLTLLLLSWTGPIVLLVFAAFGPVGPVGPVGPNQVNQANQMKSVSRQQHPTVGATVATQETAD